MSVNTWNNLPKMCTIFDRIDMMGNAFSTHYPMYLPYYPCHRSVPDLVPGIFVPFYVSLLIPVFAK